jgi:Protein of unknown function (DUF2442)
MTDEELEAPLDAETEAMIDAALERAKHEPAPVTAVSVSFDKAHRLLIVMLCNGCRIVIPQEDLQHLADASVEDAAEVEIEMLGTGIHWEKLDLDFSVEGLIEGRRGNADWMKRLHERWGSKQRAEVLQTA